MADPRAHGTVSGLAWAAGLAVLTWGGLGLTGVHGVSAAGPGHRGPAAVHDTTPPTGLRLEGGPNAEGWYAAPTEYRWTAADPESGIAWCQGGSVVAVDTAVPRTAYGTCVNGAGHAAAYAGFSYRYDGTPPRLHPVAEPPIVIRGGTVVAVPRATDVLSGVAMQGCNGNHALNTRRVGLHTITCVARDRAGNLATTTVSYLVLDHRQRD